ncbi:MAG: hypothetical protein RLY87_1492 [Chloroflexota bacterium]|jgi:hypothetical protein
MTHPEQNQSTPVENTSTNNGSLLEELRSLGTQLEAVARAFLASNKAQQMQTDLQTGVNELIVKLQGIGSNETVVEVTEKGKQFVEKALENPTVTDAHAKVVNKLGSLNDELRKLASTLADDKKRDDQPPV